MAIIKKMKPFLLFMHDIAIIKNDKLVKIVTIPALERCLILTQHEPFTILEDAPKIIINKRNRLKRFCSPKASARSEAAA